MMGAERENPTLFLSFLYLLSIVYGWGVKLLTWLYDRRVVAPKKLSCPVISIGNITVGGTGKTPMTIYIAEMIRDFGFKPAVISRGYKGAAEKTGGIVSNGRAILMSPNLSGDEPYMMARKLNNIPVLVGQERYQIGMRAISLFSPDVIILDDAFQHRRLGRDIDLALIDDQAAFENKYLLPRGPLREPVSALMRADAWILTRCDNFSSSGQSMLHQMAPEMPIFKSFHVPYVYEVVGQDSLPAGAHKPKSPEDFSFLKDAGVFLFSGIAKNEEFRRMIKEKVKDILGLVEYPDHHPYNEQDLWNIARQAENLRADYIVTTEKDYVRISNLLKSKIKMVVIGIRISFGSQEVPFREFIRKRLNR